MNSKAIGLRFGVLLAGILCAASFTACGGEKTGEAGDAKSLAAAVAENLDKIESFFRRNDYGFRGLGVL